MFLPHFVSTRVVDCTICGVSRLNHLTVWCCGLPFCIQSMNTVDENPFPMTAFDH